MKTITQMKQVILVAIMMVVLATMTNAQTALPYGPAWPDTDGFTGWTILDNEGSQSFYRNGAEIVEFEDKSTVNNDWLVSPALDFTGNYVKEVYIHAGWAEDNSTKWGMPEPYSNINLYYSINFDGTDVAAATWLPLATNVIPKDQKEGTGASKRLPYSFTIDETVAQAHIAIQLAPTYPNNDPVFPTDNPYNTRVRISDFFVREFVPTAIHDKEIQSVKLFPNPATSILNVDVTGEAEVEIYNVVGQLVKAVSISTKQLDVSDLNVGQYIIKVKQADAVYMNKFLKK